MSVTTISPATCGILQGGKKIDLIDVRTPVDSGKSMSGWPATSPSTDLT